MQRERLGRSAAFIAASLLLSLGCREDDLLQPDAQPEETQVLLRSSATLVAPLDGILDCDGQVIEGDGTGIGFELAGASDFTVRNCTFRNFATGIRVSDASKVTIEECRFEENGDALYFDRVTQSEVANNEFASNYSSLQLRNGSNSNVIRDNSMTKNENYGVIVASSHDNQILRNLVHNQVSGWGIYLFGSSGGNLLDGNVAENTTWGVDLASSAGNTLRNNVLRSAYLAMPTTPAVHDIDTSNTIDGKAVHYYVSPVGLTLDGTAGIGWLAVVGGVNVTIRNISIDTSNSAGIVFIGSTQSLIENVSVSNNTVGLRFYSSDNNTIRNFHGSGNHAGLSLDNSNNNRVESPFFDGPYECLTLSNQSQGNVIISGTFLNFAFGVTFQGAGSNALTDSYFSGGGTAVMIPGASGRNEIRRNTMEGNETAFYGLHALWTTIAENTMRNNTEGIVQIIGRENIFHSNRIEGHQTGVRLLYSTGNLLYNNLFNNTINAELVGSSAAWSTPVTPGENIVGGSFLAGNYWSDYPGSDLDGDGIGDTFLPHNSTGHIQIGGDAYPLMLQTTPRRGRGSVTP